MYRYKQMQVERVSRGVEVTPRAKKRVGRGSQAENCLRQAETGQGGTEDVHASVW